MLDHEKTVADLRDAVRAFIAARDWQPFHTPKNLSISIAIESAELMEHFQWLTPDASLAALDDPVTHAEIAEELADVVIYCLSMSNACGIDLSEAVLKKMARNEDRFPVDDFKGRFRRPQREKGADRTGDSA